MHLHAGLLSALILAQGGATSSQRASQTQQIQRQLVEWRDALRQIVKVEDITLAFDVNPSNPAPTGYAKANGKRGLEFLGLCCGRSYAEREGVHVFVRAVDPTKKSYVSHVAEFADFVATLDEGQIGSLTGQGLTLSKLGGNHLLYLAKVLGYPTGGPGMALANWDKSVLKAGLLLSVEYTDPKTGERKRLSLPQSPSSPDSVEQRKRALAGAVSLNFERPAKRVTGDLRFAPGEVMSLGDLAAAAERAFKVKIGFDKRLAESYVFVQGRFDLVAIRETLVALTRTQGAAILPVDGRDAKDAFQELTAGRLKSVRMDDLDGYGKLGADGSDFLDGKSMSVGELAAGNSALRDSLISRGVPPDAQLKLVAAIGLQVMTLGSQTVREVTDGRAIDKQVPVWLSTLPLKIGP